MAGSNLRSRLKLAIKIARLRVATTLASARSGLFSAIKRVVPPPRNPYVQNVSASSAVIAWVSEESNVGSVEYGETPKLGCKEVEDQAVRRHAITLSGLKPNSIYYYRVADPGWLPVEGRFHTAPVGENFYFSFAVIGDSGNGKKNQLAVAGMLECLEPDFILHTGDVVYPSGKDRHYDRRFFAPYGRLLREVPVFPTLGNHDVENENGAAYLKNFYLPRNDPRSTGRYYSFDWGNVHFVALNSEFYHEDDDGDPEEQKDWLERDLEQTCQPWKIVFLHRPPYSSSKHGSDTEIREDLEPVFVRHGVNLAFSGHDHHYERTVPISGVTYVVSGGAGKSLYKAGKSKWTACSRSAYHAVFVRIEGEHLSLEAVKPDGTVLDRLVLDRP
ncbi:MAG TPA: metallophosphoesterase [Rubrobacteraceae bacterium]|nr:metallophosphoesterase [Rubrobacteraceae bacterium]